MWAENPEQEQAAVNAPSSEQEETGSQNQQPILALPPSTDTTDTQPLEVGSEEGVKLDHLGPIVVNVDGSMSRIGNWDKMTELEKKNTFRIIAARNKVRLAALRKKTAAAEGQVNPSEP
jgi:hypothetical protein